MSATTIPLNAEPDSNRCQITGEELAQDDMIVLFGHRVGPSGKAILLDRLRARRPLELSVTLPGLKERLPAAVLDVMPAFFLGWVMFRLGGLAHSLPLGGAAASSLLFPLALLVTTVFGKGQSFGKRKARLQLVGARGTLTFGAIAARTILIAGGTWMIVAAFLWARLYGGWAGTEGRVMLTIGAFLAACFLADWLWLVFRQDGQTLHDFVTGTRVIRSDEARSRPLSAEQLGWSGAWDEVKILCPSCGIQLTAPIAGPSVDATRAVTESVQCESCDWSGTLHLFRPVPLEASPAPPSVPNAAVCTQHPTKHAIATCEKSGDYCCSLCVVEVDGVKLSAGYLNAHPEEREKLWPSLPPVDKAALYIAANYVAMPRLKLAKSLPETRFNYDKIECMIVWSERRRLWALAVGLLLIVAGVGAFFTVRWPFSMFLGAGLIIGGVIRVVSFARVKWKLRVLRGEEKLDFEPTMPARDFALQSNSLAIAIWRSQQSAMRAWFEKHPDDPRCPVPKKQGEAA